MELGKEEGFWSTLQTATASTSHVFECWAATSLGTNTGESQSIVSCDNDVNRSDLVRLIGLRHVEFRARTLYFNHGIFKTSYTNGNQYAKKHGKFLFCWGNFVVLCDTCTFLYLFVLWGFAVCFCNRLCCEYLQHTCCQTNEDVFLICRYFIIFFACVFWICITLSSLSHRTIALVLMWGAFCIYCMSPHREKNAGGVQVVTDVFFIRQFVCPRFASCMQLTSASVRLLFLIKPDTLMMQLHHQQQTNKSIYSPKPFYSHHFGLIIDGLGEVEGVCHRIKACVHVKHKTVIDMGV